MTPELWQRLKPLFHAALRVAPQDRAAFIDAACRDDTELKNHLEKLIKAEQEDTGSLDAPLVHVNDLFDANHTRFQPGEVILGRFRIIRPIGKGGMGEVYEAEDLQLGVVALKTIRNTVASSSDAFERFRQEVQLARRVTGPQVCRIHELYLLPASGKYPPTAFLTMEYLDGVTLFEKIRTDGPIPWKQAVGIALQICEGLRLIHENGIIHRDLKTGNIMSCKQGDDTRIVLMDFGLARDFQSEGAALGTDETLATPRNTFPQPIVGTPGYMAPEQFEGKPVSPATDIYALGIILYELVTGIHPYAADTPVAAAIRRARQPMPPSSLRSRIPRQCDRFIERCLEYDPSKRFSSADAAAKALKAGPANFENLRLDRPWVLWFASAMVLGLIAGSVFSLWQSRQYYRPDPEASRWYEAGLAALREGNNVKATRSLQEAVAHDNHFVMAHARLAEAWANLDFDGNAQRELLVAMPESRRLEPLDRMYLSAIRATVTKDSASEVVIYQQILGRLPPAQKPSGYIDLGVAYERAGDPKHALENYARAAALDKDNPAPFLHTAVLESREHHVVEADRAFERAQALFSTEMNQEGIAELDYARGYAANDNGNSAEAKQFLERSLDEASKIPSVQLEIRDLTQLSASAYRLDDTVKAKEYAERAIKLARSDRLDAWAAWGQARLAAAQMHEGDLQGADQSLHEALEFAGQSQQLRLEAFANLTLASLMNQEQRSDQVVQPALAALDYYKKNGFFVAAKSAALLLIRTQRDKGQYDMALRSGQEFLDLASKSGDRDLIRQAQEVIGTVYLDMEQYPDALEHFQNAKSLADTESTKAYGAINCAETLWRLGQYREAEASIHINPINDGMAVMLGATRSSILVSDGKYREALALTTRLLTHYPKVATEDRKQIQINKAIAEVHLGQKEQALNHMLDLDHESQSSDPAEISKINRLDAEIDLFAGLVPQAIEAARSAANHYASTRQLDSDLQSTSLAAIASQRIDPSSEESRHLAAEALDIVSKIEQTWSPQVSKTYLSRPDIQMLIRELPSGSRR
jgi:serine/threonine protein kinase